jgi:hypothetical protein
VVKEDNHVRRAEEGHAMPTSVRIVRMDVNRQDLYLAEYDSKGATVTKDSDPTTRAYCC